MPFLALFWRQHSCRRTQSLHSPQTQCHMGALGFLHGRFDRRQFGLLVVDECFDIHLCQFEIGFLSDTSLRIVGRDGLDLGALLLR